MAKASDFYVFHLLKTDLETLSHPKIAGSTPAGD